MVTYAKRPAQSPLLEQPTQKRRRTVTAPSTGPTVQGGAAIETTLSPSGAMHPAIRRSLAEQSAGSAGKSSDKQAVIKTSGIVASGYPSIAPSQVMPNAQAQPPGSSTAKLAGMLNIPKRKLNAFDGYANAKPNWPVILSIVALSVFWAAIFTVVTAALSLGSGS